MNIITLFFNTRGGLKIFFFNMLDAENVSKHVPFEKLYKKYVKVDKVLKKNLSFLPKFVLVYKGHIYQFTCFF